MADNSIKTIKIGDNSYSVGMVLPDRLAKVATSGSYNDLTDKPSIPESVDTSKFVVKSGDRGILNGYEMCFAGSASGTDVDSVYPDVTATDHSITLNNGDNPNSDVFNNGTAWCKACLLVANSSGTVPSITLGSKWAWSNGIVPTLCDGGVLVMTWIYDRGIVTYIPGANG